LSQRRYIVSPKESKDLDDQALHYAMDAGPDLGHRFLYRAHETFNLLATQPPMGWNPKLRLAALRGLRLFRVTGFEKILILYRPFEDGAEITRVVHGSQNLRRLFRREGTNS
jgi:plasmid stabilization system protein ParE